MQKKITEVAFIKINWKVRFKNKTFLISLGALVISFLYEIFMLFEVVPQLTENELIESLNSFINILAFIGVVVDPTTKGMSDSDLALTYYNNKTV